MTEFISLGLHFTKMLVHFLVDNPLSDKKVGIKWDINKSEVQIQVYFRVDEQKPNTLTGVQASI